MPSEIPHKPQLVRQSVPADVQVLPFHLQWAALSQTVCKLMAAPSYLQVSVLLLSTSSMPILALPQCLVSILMAAPAVPAGIQLLPFHSKEAALPDLGPAASWPQLMQAEEGGDVGKAAQRTGLLTFFEPHSWHQVGSA